MEIGVEKLDRFIDEEAEEGFQEVELLARIYKEGFRVRVQGPWESFPDWVQEDSIEESSFRGFFRGHPS